MKRLGILTGGGDVPGLNVVIKTVSQHAFARGQEVVGIRNGWKGIVHVDPDDAESRARFTLELTGQKIRNIDRSGGTILHSARTNPGDIREQDLPDGFDTSDFPVKENGKRDLTAHVLKNLEKLGIDALVVTGGDDTLGYAAKLHAAGFPIVGVPKTMDNDVRGTEYCLGFSTAITRSVDLIHQIRTPAGSHERIAVIELFGRNSGATALYVGMLAAVDRILVSEVPFEPEKAAELLAADQDRSPSRYAVCVVSEGAYPKSGAPIEGGEEDAYGHKKLGGIGEWFADQIRKHTGRETLQQKLAYLMRSGGADSLDRMVAMAWGTLAYDLLRNDRSGHMTALVDGQYRAIPLSVVSGGARPCNIGDYYDGAEYRARLEKVEGRSILLP